tara:strand:- start:5467 stop:7998 length:2532 start_codon:yes stop_codon:yes gene_type:complete
MSKSCLIVSYGPVPTPKYQKIEGGGQRCWGLALGLKSKGYDVTVAVNSSFPLDVQHVGGIKLINWSENQEFAATLNTYETVIMNYAMGGPMSFVVDHIGDDITLILDCYVPIYIEVSARDSVDKAIEYSNYSHDILHYNKALQRGDYFLCANIPQKHMYMGALSALGIINPYSYKKERVLLVPFGVESSLEIENKRNPYKELGIKSTDFTLLWFGGLYPWFDITPLLNSIKRLSKKHTNLKFVLVGGKNPYNQNPDFIKQYQNAEKFVDDNNLRGSVVQFVDWVDFSDRINWYQNADVVISINNPGEENIYSWRTRVMDYVWGEVPMITNGGDPLSDSLLTAQAAIKLEGTSENDLLSTLSNIISNPNIIKETHANLVKEKQKYYWEKVVEPIDTQLALNEKPFLDEKLFKEEFKPDTVALIQEGGIKNKIKKLARAPRKVVRLVRSKGVKRSTRIVADTISHRVQKKTVSRGKQYYFFSHPIDYTGAPLVLLDVIQDFTKKINKRDINLVYPGGEPPLLRKAYEMGIKMDKMVLNIGGRVIQGQLGIKPDDFVMLNTVAVYPNYRDYILGLLDSGKLNHATWFIHEDMPELRFTDLGLISRVKRLIASGKITVTVPSQQTANDYNTFFETDTVTVTPLRVEVPKKYQDKRPLKDFSSLRFVISGTPSDGRKGQLLAISAFSKFYNKYYIANPKNYRDFELHLIAIGEKGDDYISTQIRAIGDGLLGNHITYYPKVSKNRALEISHNCNITVCCSLNETFALFVAEGMLMGHPLLRNKSSGIDEQLEDGINGYVIDEQNIDDFAKKIEQLLNKKTSNADLAKMSVSSQKIAEKFIDLDYFDAF